MNRIAMKGYPMTNKTIEIKNITFQVDSKIDKEIVIAYQGKQSLPNVTIKVHPCTCRIISLTEQMKH